MILVFAIIQYKRTLRCISAINLKLYPFMNPGQSHRLRIWLLAFVSICVLTCCKKEITAPNVAEKQNESFMSNTGGNIWSSLPVPTVTGGPNTDFFNLS